MGKVEDLEFRRVDPRDKKWLLSENDGSSIDAKQLREVSLLKINRIAIGSRDHMFR